VSFGRYAEGRIAVPVVAICTLAQIGFLVTGADSLGVAVAQLLVGPWIIGPAIVAAWRSATSETTKKRRGYLVAMCAAIVTTALYWAWLLINPDPQNGIGMMLFPIAQLAALGLYVLVLERLRTTD
jgi:hypothetical protein